MSTPEAKPRGRRQTLTGRVVSDNNDKTVVVAVDRTVIDGLYHRYLRRSRKLAAHDERNECRVGDEVTIVSCRPMSKRKRWRVQAIVKRGEGISS
jgi:small subunit ribosomal protein S17